MIGKLAGTDPALEGEYVVMSAHIDHLGIGEPINGDKIYNGAMDNGSGSALLLDVARSVETVARSTSVRYCSHSSAERRRACSAQNISPRNPTVPPKSIVADINTDMFLPAVPLKILTVYGFAGIRL